jgi:hypothetical protein
VICSASVFTAPVFAPFVRVSQLDRIGGAEIELARRGDTKLQSNCARKIEMKTLARNSKKGAHKAKPH